MLRGVFAATLALVALLAALAPAGAAASGSCGHSTAAPARLSLHEMRSSELCLINRVRAHYGLHPLSFNSHLRDSAIGHSDSMVIHDYFAHEGPGGSIDRRVSRAGYLFRAGAFTVGENIGGGHGRRYGSPMAVFEEWMHSPPHRENILDPTYRDVGVGVARGFPRGASMGSATYTVDFGARSTG
ncbi:MAG TPA: CAP domain-containing protein [Solirubrobacterales bacterium]|jgi:uncharacterized protein YkwD|nr:CAP domain-containing protein [Solirubrobacterales bacterium]